MLLLPGLFVLFTFWHSERGKAFDVWEGTSAHARSQSVAGGATAGSVEGRHGVPLLLQVADSGERRAADVPLKDSPETGVPGKQKVEGTQSSGNPIKPKQPKEDVRSEPSAAPNGSPETTYHCVGGQGDRSCLFKNLYYQNGRYLMFVLKGPTKPIEVARANKYEGLFKPDIEVFSSESKIEKRVKDKILLEEPGLSVHFNPLFHNNIGHAIFDGLYPAFFATVKLKVQDRPWLPVVGVDAGCFEEGSSPMVPGDLVDAYLPHAKFGRTLRAVRAKIVSVPPPNRKAEAPKCKWKQNMDHSGVDLGGEQTTEKDVCIKTCMLTWGCEACVLFDGTCYLKGKGGHANHRDDRPGIQLCELAGAKPTANVVVKPEPGFDGEIEKVTIPDQWIVDKIRRRCMSEGIYETFGGVGKMRRLFELERDSRYNPKILLRFEEAVIGVGGAGNLVADKTGAIGGSLAPHNAMRQFRDRMLRSYDLPVDPTEMSDAKPVPPEKTLNVIVISNKRFNTKPGDRSALENVIQQLNRKGGIHAEMIDWGRIGFPSNKFREHLKKTQKADVYVSSIGTALQYVPFMRDAKIYVALGSVWMRSGQYFPTFMEQQLAGGGTPYLRTLYADPGGVLRSKQRYPHLGEDGYFCGINGTLVSELMEQAEVLLRKGFTIPIAPEENLSVEGRLIVDLCKRDAKACQSIMKNRNGGHGQALLWNECVVYEVGPWRKGNLCGSAHHDLLRQLRKEYNISGYGAPES